MLSLRINTKDITQTINSENPDLESMVSLVGPIFIQTYLIPSLLCMSTDFSHFKYFLMINQLSNFYKCFHKTEIVKESSI